MNVRQLLQTLSLQQIPALVQAVLDGTIRDMEGYEKGERAWSQRKTLKAETTVEFGGHATQMCIHLSVSTAENTADSRARLQTVWHRWFEEGRTAASEAVHVEGPSMFPAFVIPLHGGSVLIGALEDGDLFIQLNDRAAASVPEPPHGDGIGYLGEPGCFETPGVRLELINGQMTIAGAYPNLKPREIRALGRPVEMALRRINANLMVVGFRFNGFTKGWVDCPFSLSIIPADRRNLHPAGMDGRLPFVLRMADFGTMEVLYERPVRPTQAFSEALLELIEEQAAQSDGYDAEAYRRDVQELHIRFPTPDLVFDGPDIIRCIAGR